MLNWITTNLKALSDGIRFKRYEFAYKHYRKKANIHPKYAIRANTCLDRMDAILIKWEELVEEW